MHEAGNPAGWLGELGTDPRDWLLSEEAPAVRHRALRDLYDVPPEEPQVRRALAAAMAADPIRAILAAQDPEGWWVKPGPGYGPKYRGTTWQLIFLDQLGADPDDERVRAACRYVLAHTVAANGGFGVSASRPTAAPPPSSVAHCLNGNLLRALIGFGWLDDPRVRGAVEWQARSVTGGVTYYKSATSGPGFRCGANEGLPCAWGAVKALRGLARIPAARRDPEIVAAIDAGVAFLLSRDPRVADYPMPYGNTRPSGSWFKLGFPSGYVTDVLQNLEVLAELGHGRDPRLRPAIDWVLSRADAAGRWRNEYAYHGKTWVDIEQQGRPSRWVTLRVCRLLKLVAETGAAPGVAGVGDPGVTRSGG